MYWIVQYSSCNAVVLWSCSIILVSIDTKPNTNDVYVAKRIEANKEFELSLINLP